VAGGGRELDPEQNAEAAKACADTRDEGREVVLPAMRQVEAADPDRRLAGLEHMLKGEDRLKEKIADELLGRLKAAGFELMKLRRSPITRSSMSSAASIVPQECSAASSMTKAKSTRCSRASGYVRWQAQASRQVTRGISSGLWCTCGRSGSSTDASPGGAE
jgi:hypothetical protein